jgi:nucleoside-diphosphate kinase
LEDVLSIERTLVLVKPNGVARGLAGEIIARFERRGFTLKGLKLVQVSRDLAEEHYEEHRDKDFFGELVTFLTSGPVVAMAVEGVSAVRVARDMMGATDPTKAAPGTIRGDFALEIGENVVHGSDSVDSGRREIALYFTPDELLA